MSSHTAEFASYSRATYNPAIELLTARFQGHAFSPHYHPTCAIGLVEKGALTNAYRNSCPGIVSAGEIMVIYPGEVHAGKALAAAGVTYRMMYIPGGMVVRALSLSGTEQALPQPSLGPIMRNHSIAAQFGRLHQILQGTECTWLEQESLLTSLLAQLFQASDGSDQAERVGDRDCRWIKMARDYLAAHFEEEVSLNQLAELTSVSPFHLVRVFRRQMGLPPHAFQTQLRIDQAKRLLALAEPLPEIGLRVGFYDQSHFIKKFKALVGITPGQYREQLAELAL